MAKNQNNTLNYYLNEVDKYPPLSHEETMALFTSYKNGDIDAREKLILSNLRLVVSTARKFSDNGIEFLDLIQEGSIALFNAVDGFDMKKKTKFSTYAMFWIKQRIYQTISSKSRTIRFPAYITDAIVSFKKYNKAHLLEHGKYPSDEEVTESLGWNIDKVKRIRDLSCDSKFISLDEPAKCDSDDETLTVSRYIPCKTDVAEIVISRASKEAIEKSLKNLNERERQVIELRFGLHDGKSRKLQEIANIMGNISRERVRQIETKALQKLRENKELKKAYY